jgi:hypothetical protein
MMVMSPFPSWQILPRFKQSVHWKINKQEAVFEAVMQYSPILEVVSISTITFTSKQVFLDDDSESTTNMILAVGP